MTLYRDGDGDIWQRSMHGFASLIQVQDSANAEAIGDPEFTGVPFLEAERLFGLEKIDGDESR